MCNLICLVTSVNRRGGGRWMGGGGGAQCRMSIIRNGNIALLLLRKCHPSKQNHVVTTLCFGCGNVVNATL